MKKYLVTGGAGFIGSHLVDYLLSRGHRVIVLDNLSGGKRENLPSDCSVMVCDVLDRKALHQAFKGVDGCFHLAAIASVQQSIYNWIYAHEVNLKGTVEVFQQASKYNIPIVYASSAAVYGNNTTDNIPLRETLLPLPASGYAADKYACELQAKAFGNILRLPTFGLRFFNVYGLRQPPDSDYSGVISIFINRLKNKEPLTIYGSGNQQRDFIYIDDITRFLYQAMQSTGVQAPVANACTGVGTTIKELATLLGDLFGETSIEYLPSRQGDIKSSIGSPTFAEEKLQVKALYSLREGLVKLC